MVEFFSMGGHGGYIWAAYSVSLIAIAAIFVVRRGEIKRAEERTKRDTPDH